MDERTYKKEIAAVWTENPRKQCTPKCWALPECSYCYRRKAPRGRSVPLAAGADFCDSDCEGYYADPKPGHYWSKEEAEEEMEQQRKYDNEEAEAKTKWSGED